MSLFYALSAAGQSLNTNKRAIDITNKNMSNVYTEGYTRKNSVIQDLPLAGIDIATVERAFDKSLFNRYINLNQELSGEKRFQHNLDQIESIFNDVQGSGFSTALNDFFNSFNDIAVNPDDLAARYSAITSANELVGRIRNSAENITDIRTNTVMDIKDNVTKLNQLTSQLAEVNKGLKIYSADETRVNEYLDKRDNLIRDISKLIDVKIKINSDNTVNLNTAKGFNLVLNDKSTNLEFAQINGEYQLRWDGVNISNDIKNGEIGGNLKTLRFLEETEKKLDDFVSVLALTFNKQHQQGYDLYGNAGENFFGIDPSSSDTQIKASNIYVNISDPKKIAAASDPSYTNSDNTNIKALINLKEDINGVLTSSEESALFSATGLTFGGITYSLNSSENYSTIKSKSFGEGYNSLLVAPIGFESEKNKKSIESNSFLFEAVDSKMKEISSVNLDEELINLTKLQRAYQASAKIINVTDELLQTVMNLVR